MFSARELRIAGGRGIDALVFTAGIGEHAWQIRSPFCSN
jgi:acetate kinase